MACDPRGHRTLARAWHGRGAGYRHFFWLAWRGRGAGLSCNPRGHRTVARAWRGLWAIFLAWVARHGAGVARACPVIPGGRHAAGAPPHGRIQWK
eukprot:gene12280-biopygen9477